MTEYDWELHWQFDTAKYRIIFATAPELEPYDGEDIDGSIRDAINNGTFAWFIARVTVVAKETGYVIGADYLGMCCYNSVEEFLTSHRDDDDMNRNCSTMRNKRGSNVVICHYFPSMVLQAIEEARRTLA